MLLPFLFSSGRFDEIKERAKWCFCPFSSVAVRAVAPTEIPRWMECGIGVDSEEADACELRRQQFAYTSDWTTTSKSERREYNCSDDICIRGKQLVLHIYPASVVSAKKNKQTIALNQSCSWGNKIYNLVIENKISLDVDQLIVLINNMK
jgi:hypothetical protein